MENFYVYNMLYTHIQIIKKKKVIDLFGEHPMEI